jgi:hypothetical protein
MQIISFDVATKSLAVSIISYNYNFAEAMTKIGVKYQEYRDYKRNSSLAGVDYISDILGKYAELLDQVNAIMGAMFTIEYLEVKDLIPNQKIKDTNIIERTVKLQEYLAHIDTLLPNDPAQCKVLIEYQMGPNDKSRTISSQIMYHFAKYTPQGLDIQLVGPTLKNKIFLLNDPNSIYSRFVEKYTTNYAANKNHSKYNFLKIIDIYGYHRLIKNIPKKNIDDIADSALMSIAIALREKLI